MARGAEGKEGYKCRVGNISWRCYLITKLIYICVIRGLLYNAADSRAGKKTARTTGATYAMTHSPRLRMCMMGVGHVMRHDTGRVGDETSGAGLGLSGRRDGFGTKPGTSHNSIPPSRPHLEAWEGWSMPVPRHLVPGNKRQRGGGADQDSNMPRAAELVVAIAAANNSLADLIWQQAQMKEQEEQEARDATVGS